MSAIQNACTRIALGTHPQAEEIARPKPCLVFSDELRDLNGNMTVKSYVYIMMITQLGNENKRVDPEFPPRSFGLEIQLTITALRNSRKMASKKPAGKGDD